MDIEPSVNSDATDESVKRTCNGTASNHELSNTERNLHKCTESNATFANSSLLKNHNSIGISTSEKHFMCTECGKGFISSKNLKSHRRIHTEDKPYKCSECDKSFSSSTHLKYHLRTHTGEKPCKCTECGKSFIQSIDLKRHQQTHTGEKHFKCSECDKSFITFSNFKAHLLTHTQDRPYKCTQCEKSFASANNLKGHYLTHNKGEKPHSCKECGKAFTRVGDLNRHRLTHTGEKRYKCTKCEKAFTSSSYLKIHGLTHNESIPSQDMTSRKSEVEDDSKYFVTDCSPIRDAAKQIPRTKLPGPPCFADYLEVPIGGKMPHTTEDGDTRCAIRCANTSNTNGDRPYRCTQCDKSFASTNNLKVHYLTHNKGEKPHICKECGKAFTRASDRNRHRVTHTGEKRYKCSKCEKAFTSSSNLKKHGLTHTSEGIELITSMNTLNRKTGLVTRQKATDRATGEADPGFLSREWSLISDGTDQILKTESLGPPCFPDYIEVPVHTNTD